MKIKFVVRHTYGTAREEVFDLENDLHISFENYPQLKKEVDTALNTWTKKHYNHGDALPSWTIIENE